MPLNNIQAVLKKILPEYTFEALYSKACNAYDVYQAILDTIYYYTPTGNINESQKKKILQAIRYHTMTSRVGLLATYDVVVQIEQEGIEGALVECGVARGGCAAMMALVADKYGSGRTTWLFDSFEGLPEQTKEDGMQKPIRHKDRTANDLAEGYCLGTYGDVAELLYKKLGLKDNATMMVKGWFEETLPKCKDMVGKIAVLRLDGDWYESTKCCLENLYDNVVTGGWVIIDDYQLPGCKKAVDEYLKGIGSPPDMRFDANGRAYWRVS